MAWALLNVGLARIVGVTHGEAERREPGADAAGSRTGESAKALMMGGGVREPEERVPRCGGTAPACRSDVSNEKPDHK